jgi:hypothetical protein
MSNPVPVTWAYKPVVKSIGNEYQLDGWGTTPPVICVPLADRLSHKVTVADVALELQMNPKSLDRPVTTIPEAVSLR